MQTAIKLPQIRLNIEGFDILQANTVKENNKGDKSCLHVNLKLNVLVINIIRAEI